MPTNLNIDDKLLNKVKRLGRHATKREAVHAALKNYERQFELNQLFDLFGKVEYFEDYDYKAGRSRRESSHRHIGLVNGAEKAVARPNARKRNKAA
jgi:hypothetical protein